MSFQDSGPDWDLPAIVTAIIGSLGTLGAGALGVMKYFDLKKQTTAEKKLAREDWLMDNMGTVVDRLTAENARLQQVIITERKECNDRYDRYEARIKGQETLIEELRALVQSRGISKETL